MRKWLTRLAVVALLAVAGIVLRNTYFAPQPVEVTVVAAAVGTVEETVTNSKAGTVRARRRAALSPEIGGRVVSTPHREGETVAAGDLLLRLDDSSQRARVKLAERELEAAQAERERACLAAELAARELERNRALAERRIISENLLDQLRSGAETTAAACQAARVGVEAAAAAIEVTATELAKTVVRAPFDGVIAELNTELGEWITPSPPAVPIPAAIDLIDPTSIYVSAPMDEVDSARIRPGQRAKVTIDSYRDQVFPGRVVRVAPYVLDIEAQNRTVEIEVELDDAAFAATLLPGTSADVEVVLETHEGVVRVPTPTLLEGGSVMMVEDGRLVTRSVEVGLRNWDFVEILAGVQAGEAVVSSLDRPEVQPGAATVIANGMR